MKLRVYSKSKGMSLAGAQVGVQINDIDVPHVASLQLDLQAKQLNKCTITFFVDELDIDCDVEAMLKAAKGDLLEEGIIAEEQQPDVTINHAALMKLLRVAKAQGFDEGKETKERIDYDSGVFTREGPCQPDDSIYQRREATVSPDGPTVDDFRKSS